jgi:iron complex transport system ATP-binding protein
LLEARGVTIAHGRTVAVHAADLAIAPGEIVALCGPNGAGKSTLLAALAGEKRPQEGEIRIDGAPVAGLGAAELARLRAALEQDPSVAAPFTVEGLVGLGVPREIPPAAAAGIVAATLADLGLAALAVRPLAALSGGQRHRAHLARALAQLRAGRMRGGGRYLLLDEPTASLDLAFAIAAMHSAREAAVAGAGVAIVLHDLDLAAGFADRIALMADGRILACDRPAMVLTEARLTAVYATPIRVVIDSEAGLRVLPLYPPRAGAHRETFAHVHRHEPLPRVSGAG